MEAGEEDALNSTGVSAFLSPPECDRIEGLPALSRFADVVAGGAAGWGLRPLGSPRMGTTALLALPVKAAKQDSLELCLPRPPERQCCLLLTSLLQCAPACAWCGV
ncbi:hypothetical protein DUNSADRAFT_11784 [Dunaliella salina]|uniref:Encoded protein n=1 Tax=Dunaliella salina TaxID=3046 RepID=A0ABQ7GCK3_DUNSA|nr:hypothetical protein DUNSADRAFT_11784 [Dunaliella salina]|eukprot:KAF5832342.1 hypothetical protein DUNSADRAFT_11784 [Dunaliella salina]